MSKATYEEVKATFEKHGYTLLSKEYKAAAQNLEYICNKHKHRGVQLIKYRNLTRNSRCPYCMYESGNPPKDFPEIIRKEATEEMDYEYLGMKIEKQQTRILFKCKKHPQAGIQETPWSSIRDKKCSCGLCNGFGRTTNEFKKIIAEKLPNITVLGEYQGAKKPIQCKCEIHNYIWNPKASNLLTGFGCPKCGYVKSGLASRRSAEDRREELEAFHNKITFLHVPEVSTENVLCQCNECGKTWEALFGNMMKPNRKNKCPYCSASVGEIKIMQFLDKFKFKYETQKRFSNCKDQFVLPFDFYLPEDNLLIEFDGEQHYHPILRGSHKQSSEEDFKLVQKHDLIKTEYCKKHNIPLLRVPYWERNDLEYFLFDKFVELNLIEEIKHTS